MGCGICPSKYLSFPGKMSESESCESLTQYVLYWPLNQNWLNVRRETIFFYGILLLHAVNINLMASCEVSPKI